MYKRFLPDYDYQTLSEITPAFLTSLGIRGVVMDIDNTIVTYDDPEPTPEALRWFEEAAAAGIKISFVSNNEWDRVNRFNQKLAYPAYAKSAKPFIKNIRKAMQDMNTGKENTAFIGDQIFTDVWAGKRAGLTVFLVDPICDKKDRLTRFKRWLEKPIKKAYHKRKNKR
ncbi:MAG: YqeG family HAD IIIA-type phosphatase [Clostridiales bacterium]|nr:YqeG family HAD IIIA-type phosphatase [Clostridiales bacterium]